MRSLTRRLVSLLLAMAMCLSLVGPTLAEDQMEDGFAPDSSVSAQAEQGAESEQAEQGAESEQADASSEDSAEMEEPADSSSDSGCEDAGEAVDPGPSGTQEDVASQADESEPSETADDAEEASDVLCQSSEAAAPELNYSSLSMKVLESAQLTVSNAAPASFVSSDEEIVSVDQAGVVTARHVGTAVIQMTDTQGQTLSCPVEVLSSTTCTEATLYVGKTSALALKERTLLSAWSSDPDVASVDDQGNVTALSPGRAEITMTDTLGDLHICSLSVNAVLSAEGITVSEANTVQLTLYGAAIQSASSSDTEVVTVSDDGQVTGVRAGSAKITMTDSVGTTAECEVTVSPNYLARTAENATRIYNKIVELGCKHVSGVHTYSQMVKRRHCTCTTGASLALQAAGVLKVGDWVTHTKAGGVKRKLKNPSKAISHYNKLKKGTFTLYRANCKFSQLPAKYKVAGMVYVQDSNICVSAGDGYIYSCNKSSSQYRRGHYFKTKVNNGYTHRQNILYVIAPKS